MASIRSLKSDINYLSSELVGQAYLSKVLFKTMDDNDLSEFVLKAMAFREGFIAKVNHPDAKDNPKMLKAYFAKLRKDLVQQFEDMATSINKAK